MPNLTISQDQPNPMPLCPLLFCNLTVMIKHTQLMIKVFPLKAENFTEVFQVSLTVFHVVIQIINAKEGSMHDNTSTQFSEILPTSKMTFSSSRITSNASSSSSSDQSNNNATLSQILSCLTDLKQDIKTLKNDIFHLEQEQSKLIHKVGNIELEFESFESPSYELDDEMKDYFDAKFQSASCKLSNYDAISFDNNADSTSQH